MPPEERTNPEVSPHVWTVGDGRQARAEGWDLFWVSGGVNSGRNQIQRIDCPEDQGSGATLDPVFHSDDAVVRHLQGRGDPLARKALAMDGTPYSPSLNYGAIYYWYHHDDRIDAVTCGVFRFLYVEYLQGEKVDPETAWRNAIHEYLETEEGRKVGARYSSFNWGDAWERVPTETLQAHGIYPAPALPHHSGFTVNHDENLAPFLEEEEDAECDD